MATSWNFKHIREGHFYASSMGEWRVDKDPARIINIMKKGGDMFSLWWVPVSIDSDYTISCFAPQVEGAVLLGHYRPD